MTKDLTKKYVDNMAMVLREFSDEGLLEIHAFMNLALPALLKLEVIVNKLVKKELRRRLGKDPLPSEIIHSFGWSRPKSKPRGKRS